MSHLTTAREVDEYCRDNIYNLLQLKTRFLYPTSELLVEKELYEKYVTFAFGSKESHAKRGSKVKRKLWMKNFDNAIVAWLDKNYPHRSIQVESEESTSTRTSTTYDPQLNIKQEPELTIVTVLPAPSDDDASESDCKPEKTVDGPFSDDSQHSKSSQSEDETGNDCRANPAIVRSRPLMPCELCGKKVMNLQLHLSTFHSDFRYNCKECDFSTKYCLNMKTHQNRIHTKSKMFSCKLCSRTFSDQSNRNRHIKQAHQVAKVKFECHICQTSTTFSRQDNLKLHLKRIHGLHPTRVMTKLQCDRCGAIYATKVSLIRHMRSTHFVPEGRQTFKCSICTLTFRFRCSLISHLDAIHLKKFCCRYCCKVLGNERTLETHETRRKCQKS